MHTVELIIRQGCGSCVRIHEQIEPIITEYKATLIIRDIADDPDLKADYGDRVPVILLDGEEFSCWEVDNEELKEALSS